ncbi:MAG: hypothetical protein HY862_02365 [Chloroflexi bacterium]|nr:hypothetical protein [Chloroflexota bacterium]
MSQYMRKVDSSPRISRFIMRLSSALSTRRGWPLLAGTVLIVISFLCFGVVIFGLVMSDSATPIWLWMCLPLTLLHLAIFAGFTGAMLAIPLGEGYQDTHK